MIDVKDEQIRLYARQLKVPTFANYRDILRQCKPEADFTDLLLDLMMAEASSRQENQTKRRLKAAAFPFQKTLDDFDMTQLNKSVSPVFLQELASCKFIADRQNIVMIGNPGRGKTHIAIALGIKACLQGYRVLFKNASTLSTELTEARDNYQLGRLERQLDKTDLLILDELSYLSFNKFESDLLFKVLSDRSERSSTIVTTNLPFSKWTELFENTTMVAALVDRLTYRSHVLDMNGPSYRLLATKGGSDVQYHKPVSWLKYSVAQLAQIFASTWLKYSLTFTRYLREHRPILYTNLKTTGQLRSHLADVEEQANALFLRLVKDYAASEGVTEQLKAQELMEWVRRMNGIRARVTEVVNSEVIIHSLF